MKNSKEHEYLLNSVKRWFNHTEQIEHYTREIEQGLTAAEQYLLSSLPSTGSILDIGCGAGRVSMFLAERGYRVTGIDVSEGMLFNAREVSKKKNLFVDFCCTDGIMLPFKDAEFDIIIGFKVLCYVPTRELRNDYLREIYRVIKPGGYCIIIQNIVPDEYLDDAKDEYFYSSPASQFKIIERGDNFPSGKGYVKWFTEDDLLNEIRNTDFEIELFGSDEDHEGAGYIRLIKLRKS